MGRGRRPSIMLKGFPLRFLRPPRLPASKPISQICKINMSVMAQSISPKFISLEKGRHAAESICTGFRFRLVSYNILAQVYVKSSSFPHSPSSCLKWKSRSQAILADLKNIDADFLCIQELDEYDRFYKKIMESFGYSSLYIQRTGEKRDGCGIFYKSRSAEVVLTEEVHYNDLVDFLELKNGLTDNEDGTENNHTSEDASIKDLPEKRNNFRHGDPNDPRVRLKRDCVGQLAAFKLNDPSGHLIVVANTHIYWDPDWADVKLAQAKYLVSRLSQFKALVSVKFNCTPSVIVAGDFNSTPGDEVYKYLLSANSNSAGEPLVKLCSLYATNGGEPIFTNCTSGFTGTLDYIFLSDSSYIRPVSLLHVPGPDSTDIIGGLPNHHHPSDHLPIGGDFEDYDLTLHSA
ncbi:carbon catabolite repressor protein 4 homolog 4 isoform X2 [Typha angustifolia]|uniref:carbon catabolite repressor protein 4 homolog 4 isoform X2 n=1 Tax=Typha angustifolia TaxID=59011 RepID=UPI003C2AADA8